VFQPRLQHLPPLAESFRLFPQGHRALFARLVEEGAPMGSHQPMDSGMNSAIHAQNFSLLPSLEVSRR